MGNLSDLTTQGGTLPDLLALAYGPYNALDYVLSGPTGSELETWLGDAGNETDFDAVLATTKGAEMWARSSAAVSAIIASTTARGKLVASANAMSFIARERSAIEIIAADATAMSTVAGSTTAMSAVANSSVALDGASATENAADVVASSATAMGEIGDNPTAFATFVAGASAAKAVASNASVLTTLLSTSADLGELFNNAAARTAIGSLGPAYDAIKDDGTAIAKYVAAAAGLDATTITGTSDVVTSATTLRDVFLLDDASDVFWRSATMSDAFWTNCSPSVPYSKTDNTAGGTVQAPDTSGNIEVRAVPFNGGSRLECYLNAQAGSEYFEPVTTFDVNVDGISTLNVLTQAVSINTSSSYVDGSLGQGGSDSTYWDAGDQQAPPFNNAYSLDVSALTGTITVRLRANIRDSTAGPAGYVRFGQIRLVA